MSQQSEYEFQEEIINDLLDGGSVYAGYKKQHPKLFKLLKKEVEARQEIIVFLNIIMKNIEMPKPFPMEMIKRQLKLQGFNSMKSAYENGELFATILKKCKTRKECDKTPLSIVKPSILDLLWRAHVVSESSSPD